MLLIKIVLKLLSFFKQVECHPYLAQKKLSAWMKERHIELTSYSPLGSPTSPLANPEFKVLLKDPLLPQIASKYGKTVAQILLRLSSI